MQFGELRKLLLITSVLSLSCAASNAQDATGPVVVTFPSASQQQQALAQQQAYIAQQQAAAPVNSSYNTGVGYYNPGYGSGQTYGNVPLCGKPPYVYPCSYEAQSAPSPYANSPQPLPPANAARAQETFGLGQGQQTGPGPTFARQPGNYVDQSPSTTSNGTGNTAGPILAQPPASSGTFSGGPYTRDQIMDPSSSFYSGESRGTNVRQNQIRNAAYQVGIKAGYAAEAQRINNSLLKYRYALDKKFDFRPLLEQDAIVPPVITTVTDIVERRSSSYLYLTTGAYQIVQGAYVTAKTPVWQDYIKLDGNGPTPPAGIKIKDARDKALWSEAAKNGWDRGVLEARAQFSEGLNRLDRDFRGMQTYRRLADQGAVSLTGVKISRKNGEIYLNGRKATGSTTRIIVTVQPKFKSTQAVASALAADRLKDTGHGKR